MGLPLYLIERLDKVGWDEAKGFVVAAENADVARVLLASPEDVDEDEDAPYNQLYAGREGCSVWLDDSKTSTKCIALESTYAEPTVVLRSLLHG